MLDQGERNITFDQTEFLNMDASTRDSEYNALAQEAGNDLVSRFVD